MLILGIIIWYLCGVFSFVYWWTSQWDYERGDILITLFIGFCGPIAFLMGWIIHGAKSDCVLVKKRGL